MSRSYTPDEIWHLIVRYRWIILVPLALGIAAAPLLARYVQPRYRSEASILVVPPQVPENYVQSTVVEKVEDRLPAITAMILSRSRLERIRDTHPNPNVRREAAETLSDLASR